MANILVVDDEEGIRSFVADSLKKSGHNIQTAVDGEDALAHLSQHVVDLIISDLTMPKLDGMALLAKVKSQQPETEFIIMTAHGSVKSATDAMKAGAYDYLTKPLSGPAELRLLVARALERRTLLNFKERHTPKTEPVSLAYQAQAMVKVEQVLQKVAKTDATVLLLGESGTGKEVCAQRIHSISQRHEAPFIAINCAALTDTLLESTLFGHEKGAFTGADKRQRGQLELAQGGTFFLDEIGELKPELQAKLLRVLQERTFQRVGGHQLLTADVRFVAATNRELATMVSEGTFREDLYHRLAVFPIKVPSLAQRQQDIPDLARVLFSEVAKEMGRTELKLDEEVCAELQTMSWPGNIRQLRNTLERAVILCDGNRVTKKDIWTDPGFERVSKTQPIGAETLAELEKRAVLAAMQRENGNRAAAAKSLGISVRSLYDRLKRYDSDG